MEKANIIRFLKEGRRGVYDLIVETYQEIVSTMNTSMALTLIQEDLEAAAGEKVRLNYFSLNRAISKLKKAGSIKVTKAKNFDFRDDHEIKKTDTAPGKFKVD